VVLRAEWFSATKEAEGAMLQNVEMGLTLRTPQGSRMVGDQPAAMENPTGMGSIYQQQ